MKFPITKAEFLAWCRENRGKRVKPRRQCKCLIAEALHGCTGRVWEVGYCGAWLEDDLFDMPQWSISVMDRFDGVFAYSPAITVRTALRQLAEAGVPGFTKKELREAAGLE